MLWPLVGFTSLFTAFLVDVVWGFCGFPVGLAPGGDPFVDGVGVVLSAALGQVRLSVEDINGVVVGGVLLGAVVADGLAVGRVVP